MNEISLSVEQQAEAQRLVDAVAEKVQQEVQTMARLLATTPTSKLLGEQEFQLRDLCHRVGNTVLQAALDERKKGGTEVPA